MKRRKLYGWLMVGLLVALPRVAQAQEATLSGTVTDTTGGALPGVTVRAVHEASGNSFEAVTDERGDYRLAVRVGGYRVTAELAGFAPVTRTTTLLVGQAAVLNLQMAVSGLEETVTVTGEAPLLNVTESSLGGNIDPRQMETLPVQGRNWMDLVVLAPGARATAADLFPVSIGGTQSRGDFQISIDGQQVTMELTYTTGVSQPRFSRDAIAEFEFVSSRFDATQGRSVGVQVNAVTKSGTNTPSGTFAGYFRDDRFNAADFVAKRVLPYQNQQLSWTFGGPIRKDRVHFFAHYEYEREPQTAVFTTPYPAFNIDVTAVGQQHKAGGRLDAQFSPRTRLAVRGTVYRARSPLLATAGTGGGGNIIAAGGGTSTPSALTGKRRPQNNVLATLTQVLSNRAVNEVKVGFADLKEIDIGRFRNPRAASGWGAPSIILQGLTLGGGGVTRGPYTHYQLSYNVRNDFTYSFTKGGGHTLKLGGEYQYLDLDTYVFAGSNGTLDARGGPIPANIESLIPNLFDPTTWNLNALSPIAQTWRQTIGPTHQQLPRHVPSVWAQDDWTLSPRLTLNLGLRYELETNAFANEIELLPFLPGNRPNDTNNVGPRVGLNFSANNRTVLRGGFGLYHGTVTSGYFTVLPTQTVTPLIFNNGRPDFASNPFGGPEPSYESLRANLCTPALVPGCFQPETLFGLYNVNSVMPQSYQSSIGLQRQLGATMAIEADYVYVGARKNITAADPNVNMTFDPATGANYPFRDQSRRAFPEWGVVVMRLSANDSNLHSLQTSWTKRMSQGWQASGTYTLSGLWDRYARPQSGNNVVPFPTAPDLGGEYGLGVTDQRHRAVFNGIWQLRYGFQLSGLYFFGSGQRYPTAWGVDLRNVGGGGEARLRPNGTIVPRNNFVGKPVHRVDARLQRRFPLGGRAGIDGILEVFNVFNHANYGSYVTSEISRIYGQPQQNPNVAYTPRALQLGFRFAF